MDRGKVTLKKKSQEVQDIVRQASCSPNLVVECAHAGDAKRAKVDGVDNSPRRRAGVVMNLGVGPFVSVYLGTSSLLGAEGAPPHVLQYASLIGCKRVSSSCRHLRQCFLRVLNACARRGPV